MNLNKNYRSPHFEDKSIPVEFVILHYTAQNLEASLDIFVNQNSSEVSCHLLIDERGQLYELVDCWAGNCYKAFHAGHSHWTDSQNKKWENFNNFSVGIEIINLNGNVFPYTKQQYATLFKVLTHLQTLYPNLKNPERILGHEQIAGFRGKCDPGYLFDWHLLFREVYQHTKTLKPLLSQKQQQSLIFIPQTITNAQAKKISTMLEQPWPFWLKILLMRVVVFFKKFIL